MTRATGTFLERLNRFVARIRLDDGSEPLVHIASSGRMVDVLIPGSPAIVDLTEPEPGRKTAGRLVMARVGATWVSVDTALPGRLFRQALSDGLVGPFTGYTTIRPEYVYGKSRIDFLLTGPDLPPCLVEVKSVTSALPDPDGTRVARFPDAPTERGARHLRELMAALPDGYRTAVCFIIQRDDIEAFGPYDAIDPAFGIALRTAVKAGVNLHAFRSHVSPDRVQLGSEVPLRL